MRTCPTCEHFTELAVDRRLPQDYVEFGTGLAHTLLVLVQMKAHNKDGTLWFEMILEG